MKDYVICTDSCVDLPHEIAKKLELNVIPLSFQIEGNVYYNHLDERDMKHKEFYDLLRNKKISQTSQINLEQFKEFFETFLKAGKDILYIGFSSALSGTLNSSLIARMDLEEMYPDRKIVIVDSLSASMGQGLLLTHAANLRLEGKSIDEVATWVEENKLRVCHLFTVGDLHHLKRSGRLSQAKALLGTVLRIKPILHVDKDGKLVQTGQSRGRRTALKKLVERMKETIENPEEQIIYISHADCYEEVIQLKQEILNEIPIRHILINFIGPVIGSHAGPGTIAIFYFGNDRLG